MNHQHPPVPPRVILRRRDVQARTGLSKSAIYRATQDGTFPRQVRLGPRSVGWIEEEVHAWIEQRIEDSRAQNEHATRDSSPLSRDK